MGTTDYPPTEAAIKVKEELVSHIDAELSDWQKVKNEMLGMINKMIRNKALDTIILKDD